MIKKNTINGSISLAYFYFMKDLFINDLGTYFGGIIEKFHHYSKFELDYYNVLSLFLDDHNINFKNLLNPLHQFINFVEHTSSKIYHNEFLLSFKYFHLYINHSTSHSFPTNIPLDLPLKIPIVEVSSKLFEITNNTLVITLFEYSF